MNVDLAEAIARLKKGPFDLRQRIFPLLEELGTARAVMQSVTNGITVADAIDPNLPLIYINPAFERMTGYRAAEVLGRNCRFLQGDDRDQPALQAVRDAIREERDTMAVLRNYRKNGTPFWNELYLSPIRAGSGDRVTHFVGIQSDVTRRIEYEQRLAFLAEHDSLTGLANRELLFDRLAQAILRARRGNLSVVLIFLDLDHFKHVNDTLGHEAGDELLRRMASLLQTQVRACDTVARFGGDEFVLMLPDLDHDEETPHILQRLRKRISEKVDLRGHQIVPSASFGWSSYPRHGLEPAELLRIADFAMYAEKHTAQARQQKSPETSARRPSFKNLR